MRKSLQEVIVRAIMSLYQEAKTKVIVGSKICNEFWAQVGFLSICVVASNFCSRGCYNI